MKTISVYALNLPKRQDRLQSILQQFRGKSEFDFKVISVIQHQIGAYGQWRNFVDLVQQEEKKNSEYFIFCEDDHVFTKDYNFKYLQDCINEAENLKADILCGGVGFVRDAIQCTSNLYWMNVFNGMQFTIVFNRFYKEIIQSDTNEGFISDIYLSEISDSKFVMYPFISLQKEFGYSDITEKNKQKGYLQKCFQHTQKKIEIVKKVRTFYQQNIHGVR